MMQIVQIPVSRIKEWAENPRKNDQAVGAVEKSIERFGFNVPVLCDRNSRLIAGHTRLKAARRLGLKNIPAIILSLSEKDKKAFAIAENKTGELAEWDSGKLKHILEQLRDEDFDLKTLGFVGKELRRLLQDDWHEENKSIPVPSNATTKPGDILILGRHRVFCGDSCLRATFKKAIGTLLIDHVFAGPPYFNQRRYSHWQEYEDYLNDMRKIAENCYSVLGKGGIVTWNIANGYSTKHAHVAQHCSILEEAGFQFQDMIIWAKTGPNYQIPRCTHIVRNQLYLPASQWEALLIYKKPGKMKKMSTDGAKYMWQFNSDIWQIPAVSNQIKDYGHPAVCPVEIPYRTLLAYSDSEGIVIDPFGGSGTTLIAAEKTGRTAILIEKQPAYCDTIARRWENLTGKRARRTRTAKRG